MMTVIAAVASALFVSAEADTTLADYRWNARPIVVFAGPNDPRLAEQRALFEAARGELLERDNVVIVDLRETSALRRRFRPGAFTVLLVGKDGGEKFRRDEIVDPDDLHALIDTMPMRRREMRHRGEVEMNTQGGDDR